MKKTWKSSVLLLGTAMLGAAALSGTNAMAGNVNMGVDVIVTTSLVETVTNDLNFGTIDLNPAGDTISIDASAATVDDPAAAVTTISQVNGSTTTGATSGLVTIESAGPFNIAVTYPGSVPLVGTAGNAVGAPDLALTQINANSVGGAVPVAKAGGTDATIHVGGEIVFPANTAAGTYAGTMLITFNYNP